MFSKRIIVLWVKYFLLNSCFLLTGVVFENIVGMMYFDEIRNGYFDNGLMITSILTKIIYGHL
jgi:hypothetical protein